MSKRREVQVVRAAPDPATPVQTVEEALNSEDHRNHGLEGVYAQPNGDVVIVWRVAT